jgi:hypothetical protein
VRTLAIVAFVAVGLARAATAQDRAQMRPAHPVVVGPTVSVAPVLSNDDTSDDVTVAARRFVEEWSDRLRPIEQRLRDDSRLRRAGAIVGLSAAAVGALRGQQTLTFVGTQAIRVGLDRQLSAIRAKSGFSVEPTIGYRRFAITVNRTFP